MLHAQNNTKTFKSKSYINSKVDDLIKEIDGSQRYHKKVNTTPKPDHPLFLNSPLLPIPHPSYPLRWLQPWNECRYCGARNAGTVELVLTKTSWDD